MQYQRNFGVLWLVEEPHTLLDHRQVPTELAEGDVVLWFPELSEFRAELRIARNGICLPFVGPDGVTRWGARSRPHSMKAARWYLKNWVSTAYFRRGFELRVEEVRLLPNAQELIRGVVVKRAE